MFMKTGKNAFKLGFRTSYQKNFHRSANNVALRPALLGAFSLMLGIFAGTYAIPVNSTFANSHIDVPADATSRDYTAIEQKTPVEKTETDTLATATAKPADTASTSVATKAATTYTSAANLQIPALGIYTSVTPSTLTNNELSVPSSSVSVYGSLLMGHSSGVFGSLSRAAVGQEIVYNGATYVVDSVRINLPVDQSSRQYVGNFSMYVLTNLGSNRIVLMTCAGNYQSGFGYTGRTLVFATQK